MSQLWQSKKDTAKIEAPRASCESVKASMAPHTTKPTPVSIANQRSLQGMAHISRPLSPASSRNGSRWFAASDQAEKNRLMKKVLLEKICYDGHVTSS